MIEDKDKHNIMSDDEYQFPKEEYMDHSGSDESSADASRAEYASSAKPGLKERFPFLGNKKFLLGGGVVLVILIGLGVMHHGPKKVDMQQPTMQPVVTHSVQAPQVADQLSSIQAGQSSNQGDISNLKNHVEQLHEQLANMQSTNTALTQTILQLTAQIKGLTSEVQANSAKLAPKPKKAKNVAPVVPITYSLKAIVTGRAWVVSSNGNAYTVSVGDKLAQYGTIESIDADAGRIVTSSGKVIVYGKNDS